MDDTQLRSVLIEQAGSAYYSMALEVNELFDAIHDYAEENPVWSPSLHVKLKDLKMAVGDMARLMNFIAHIIEGWRYEQPRVITRLGVEQNYLNELKATIDSTAIFFERQDLDLVHFNPEKVSIAYSELVRCNRLL